MIDQTGPDMRGKLAVTVHSLEMTAPPGNAAVTTPSPSARILHVPTPTTAFYRFLYHTIGEEWLWSDRRRMSDDTLAAIISHDKVDLYVLYVDNQPAGYAELDGRQNGEIELAYFGLMPGFAGMKLGPFLLDFAIRKAFEQAPRRLWVHTCSLDHPAALSVYQKCGFSLYDTKAEVWDDPRLDGTIPAHSAPHVPLSRET